MIRKSTTDGQFNAEFEVKDGRAIGTFWDAEKPRYGEITVRKFNVKLRGKDQSWFQVGGDSFKRSISL